MAKRTLATAVAVLNPKTGLHEVFVPGQDVPSWAAKKITNPSAWGQEVEESAPAPASTPEGTPEPESDPEKDPDGEQQEPAGDDGDGGEDQVPASSDPVPDSKWKIPQIEEFADVHGIDLTGAGLKAEMLDRIADALSK